MTTEPRPASPDHLPALDGLRAIAVIMVLWFHIPQASLPDWSGLLVRITRPGYFGVDFFFVLSGFLITRILIHYRRRSIPLRYFFLRRSLRIFPAYYLLIGVMAVVAPSWGLVWSAFYLANIYFPLFHDPSVSEAAALLHHLWSLSVEEHFYLVWPFLVTLPSLVTTERLMKWVVLPGSILSAVLFAWIWDGPTASDMIWQNTLPRSLSLAAGGLLALHEGALRAPANRGALWSLVAAIFGAASLAIGKKLVDGDAWLLLRLVGGSVLSTGVVAFVIAAPERWSVVRVLRASPLRHIGQISYGLYLYHHPIYYYLLLRDETPPSAGKVLLAIAMSYGVAMASYTLWERPFLRLKDLWATPKPPNKPPAETPRKPPAP